MKKMAATGKKSTGATSAKAAGGKRAAKAVVKRATAGTGKAKETTAKRAAAASSQALLPPLEALLHTMRVIAQHEDELCTLLHDARRSGRLSSPLRRELEALLTLLPADDLGSEVHAVLRQLR